MHHEQLDPGAHTVNASTEAGTTVALTVQAGNQTDIDIARYESPPFPGASFPDQALGIYIDILVSNPGAVDWPIHVEVSYTDAEVATAGIDESTLGLYYYNATGNAFVRCSDTGVDTTNNVIWANVTQEEAGYLVGTPFAAGGQLPAPPPPPQPVSAVPTLSQWGMIAMAILFVGALAWTVRLRKLVAGGRVR